EESFKAIRSANTTLDLLVVAGELAKNGIPTFVNIKAIADGANAAKNALFGFQPPLPLPEKYYSSYSEWISVEPYYKLYIKTVLNLAGYTAEQAAAAVLVIISFEKNLADVALSKLEELEAIVSPYTALTFYQLDQKYPLLIGSWLKANGFDVSNQSGGLNDWVGFTDLTYFDKTEELLKNTALDVLRTIVEYKLIHASSTHLSPAFRTANWKLFGRLAGQEEEPTRETFCVDEVETTVGELLSQYFIDEVWSADTAKSADELVKALESSFSTGIAIADWLDNSTRSNAQTKLSKFEHLLGGPKNPQLYKRGVYPTLTLDSRGYLNNRWKISQVNIDTNLKLNGQPVDKRKFPTSPHSLNAYYFARRNLIVFPAAVLQSPIFDAQFDAAQNFGAIGVGIGHEISHGFDYQSRNYDGDGNLNPWWSNATSTAFETKAQCFIDQYDKFVVKSEFTDAVLGNVDGHLSLGETIADNGGLKTSFRAYHEYIKKFPSQYTEEAGDKLFYLAFAQNSCSKNTDGNLKGFLSDPHPPHRYRVTGALQNDAEFARVFKCPINSDMNPSQKCLLWE
ncbi:hypothetical protein DYB36_014152, partial [Aphanomyces astaci]